MLPSANDFANTLAALPPTDNAVTGINNFVSAIADFTNQIQAGSQGTVGILTFGNAAMITALSAMKPVSDNSWINNLANAWEAGITTSVIAPGTVTNSEWSGSGDKDTETSPSAPSTITTIAAAKSTLISGLQSVVPTAGVPLPMAVAFRNAALALTFTCIGLGPPPTETPIPIEIPGQ